MSYNEDYDSDFEFENEEYISDFEDHVSILSYDSDGSYQSEDEHDSNDEIELFISKSGFT